MALRLEIIHESAREATVLQNPGPPRIICPKYAGKALIWCLIYTFRRDVEPQSSTEKPCWHERSSRKLSIGYSKAIMGGFLGGLWAGFGRQLRALEKRTVPDLHAYKLFRKHSHIFLLVMLIQNYRPITLT